MSHDAAFVVNLSAEIAKLAPRLKDTVFVTLWVGSPTHFELPPTWTRQHCTAREVTFYRRDCGSADAVFSGTPGGEVTYQIFVLREENVAVGRVPMTGRPA